MTYIKTLRALTLAFVCVLATHANATPDPVTWNYEQYRAAIDRGDTPAAEAAAAAALAASQERDGEGGATATLAYNLALVRIDDGRPAEALEPATLARRIAEANPTIGLDPLNARLVYGQAQLAASPAQGVATLRTALTDATERRAVDDRAFRAAAALGAWALEQEQYGLARSAWAQAVSHVNGQAPADILARERARTAQAVAIIAEHAESPRAAARDQAYALLTDAMDALYPYAIERADDNALTPFQAAYAEAAGWRSYGRAAYTPMDSISLRDLRGQTLCAVSWSGGSGVGALLAGAFDGSTGVAVFRILTDNTGDISSIDVAFATPPQEFSSSVIPHLERLNAHRASRSARDCVMPQVIFQTIVFYGDSATRRR